MSDQYYRAIQYIHIENNLHLPTYKLLTHTIYTYTIYTKLYTYINDKQIMKLMLQMKLKKGHVYICLAIPP